LAAETTTRAGFAAETTTRVHDGAAPVKE